MKLLSRFIIPFMFILISINSGCIKEPKYSTVPFVSFNNMQKYRVFSEINQAYIDSLVITINFQDGDGNLGTTEQNATQNYLGEVYLKDKKGAFNKIDFNFLDGKFPPLNTSGKKGPIDGTLTQGINLGSVYADLEKGTYKFKIRIKDEDGNFSNWTETTTIDLKTTP